MQGRIQGPGQIWGCRVNPGVTRWPKVTHPKVTESKTPRSQIQGHGSKVKSRGVTQEEDPSIKIGEG